MALSKKYKGIVISVRKTGEQSKSLDLLTEEVGLVHCVARNASKSKRRFSGVLEPFTSATFQVKGSNKYRPTLETVDEVISRFAISRSMSSFYLATYACQWIKIMAKDAESHSMWYKELADFLDWMSEKDCSFITLFWFELLLLHQGGVMPDLEVCPHCDCQLDGANVVVFDTCDGMFVHQKHLKDEIGAMKRNPKARVVSMGDIKIMSRLLVSSQDECMQIKLSAKQVDSIGFLLESLLKIHFGKIPSSRESFVKFMEI